MAVLRYMSGHDLTKRRAEREDKLAWIDAQVRCGELVIRQATPQERERFGIPAAARAGRRTSPAAG